MINHIAPEAADTKSFSAIVPLVSEFLQFGDMRFRELCVFAAVWLFPRPFCRRLRDFLNKFRPALLKAL
jgi:hypothetical protein